ncbi:unnamed protein product [Rhizophagus irregularis]|nr:unnamed protein product [Rhizophagus irregularis]
MVKCFTSRHFMMGIQSTQHVKSENTLIQKAIQSSFFLSQVQESIENWLEFEPINNCYSIWKSSTLQVEADEDQEFDLKSLISMVNSGDILEIWKVLANIIKQLKFGTLMGEAKKAIQFVIQNDDDELIQFIREYNIRREAQLIQAESIRQQEALIRRKMIANDNRVFHNTRGVWLILK